MVNISNLSRPPVKEALIDLRVKYAGELTVERLDSVYELLKNVLPKKTVQSSVMVSFSSKGPELKKQEQSIEGYVFKDKQNTRVLQVNKEGITFSLIGGYPGWEDFEKEFWHFINLIKPELAIRQVYRLGVRFINKILIGYPISNGLEEFFNVSPVFKIGANKTVPSEMFTRAVLPEENDYTCILTLGINPKHKSNDGENIGVILDVDVFKMGTFELSPASTIKSMLKDMRQIKNNVFFAAITEKTEELLK